MKSTDPINHIFDKAFNHMDELETILQYVKSERDFIKHAILPEDKFKCGWKQLVNLYHSKNGHCLKCGCGAETLMYWANNEMTNKHSIPMHESKWFWKTVLKIAVQRGWAIQTNDSGCRSYRFL